MRILNKEIEFKIKKLKIGDTFKAVNSNQTFSLEQIIEKQAGKKLPEPLYVWKYINSSKTFINRIEDIRRAFLYSSWINLKK